MTDTPESTQTDESVNDRSVWERRPRETPKSFAAFLIYLSMPPHKRSVDGAYKSQGGAAKRNASHWRLWCRKHEWVARAAAYDEYTLNKRLAEREMDRERARQIIIDKLDELSDGLLTIALSGNDEGEKLRAIKLALGIGGLSPTTKQEIAVSGGSKPVSVMGELDLDEESTEGLRDLIDVLRGE